MTLQLTLPPRTEERLAQEAVRLGETSESVALKLLDEHLPPPLDERRAATIAMLEQWMKEDESLSDEEMAENADILRKFDEDRLSDRKLFTDILAREAK